MILTSARRIAAKIAKLPERVRREYLFMDALIYLTLPSLYNPLNQNPIKNVLAICTIANNRGSRFHALRTDWFLRHFGGLP